MTSSVSRWFSSLHSSQHDNNGNSRPAEQQSSSASSNALLRRARPRGGGGGGADAQQSQLANYHLAHNAVVVYCSEECEGMSDQVSDDNIGGGPPPAETNAGGGNSISNGIAGAGPHHPTDSHHHHHHPVAALPSGPLKLRHQNHLLGTASGGAVSGSVGTVVRPGAAAYGWKSHHKCCGGGSTHGRPLSAQSTLESLSLHPAAIVAQAAAGGSPASTAAVSSRSGGGGGCAGSAAGTGGGVVSFGGRGCRSLVAAAAESGGSPEIIQHQLIQHQSSSSASAAAASSILSTTVTDGGCSNLLISGGGGTSSVTAGRSKVPNTAASLGPLFACVSAYLSSADVRAPLPFKRLYDPRGPVVFASPPLRGVKLHRGELKLWETESERIISQNSSNRRVHRVTWTSVADPATPRPGALKFVEDGNPRDGRSLKREIECHIYVYQKLPCLFQWENELRSAQLGMFSFTRNPEWAVTERLEDAWPSAELFGYHLDKKNPGKSVLLTRKLSGPDLFDVIRAEHNHNWHFHNPANSNGELNHKCRTIYSHRIPMQSTNASAGGTNSTSSRTTGSSLFAGFNDKCAYYPFNYEYHKLRWCALALKRISQYASLSIRHNDVKPDNIVLDFYQAKNGHKCLDVKLIDLGTASMHNAKDFTGGTSWYESPEQKLLEYFMKKKKDPEAAKRVEIDLPSDLWGTGISLAEVLVGRRVVDTLKTPHGPGSLEYLGYDGLSRAQGRSSNFDPTCDADSHADGGHLENYPFWAVDPADWLLAARKALGLDRENSGDQVGLEAARWIFTHLVRPYPENRVSLSIALNRMERFAEEAYKRYRHVLSSFDMPKGASGGESFPTLPEAQPKHLAAPPPPSRAEVAVCSAVSRHPSEIAAACFGASSPDRIVHQKYKNTQLDAQRKNSFVSGGTKPSYIYF